MPDKIFSEDGIRKRGKTMKCLRTVIEANVEKYVPGMGMEDGFELYSDVITKSWINTENLIRREDGAGRMMTPYIHTRRGRIFLCEGDYIIKEADGTVHACGEDKIFKRYKKIED